MSVVLSDKDQALLEFRRNSMRGKATTENRGSPAPDADQHNADHDHGSHGGTGHGHHHDHHHDHHRGSHRHSGGRRGSVHDDNPLGGSCWDWKTDGVTTDASLKLMEQGQVQWNFGSPQGYWKLDEQNHLVVCMKSETYTVELHEENKHGTVMKPSRNPKPKVTRQAPTITYQIETEETAGSITFKSSGRFRMSTDGREGNWSVHRNVMRLDFETGGFERVSSFDLGNNFTGESYVVFQMDCAEPPTWWTHHFEGSEQLSPCPALHFVDHPWFQAAIGSVIFINIMTMAGETDFADWAGWPYFNNFFLLIFTIELLLRIGFSGPYFFAGREKWWHALDSVIVGLGIFDFVADSAFRRSKVSGNLSKHSSVLRIMRLLRLLRLLRVFNLFPSMGAFLQALWEMIHKFVWIFLVLFFFIFCSAIILTRTLGKMEAGGEDETLDGITSGADDMGVHDKFRDVWRSWFTLFQVTTTDNWDRVAYPIIDMNPLWRIFFVTFIVFASWVLISVLTAVASDSMIAMTTDKRDMERKEQEKRHASFIRFLKECFLGADEDGNGVLDREEFVKLMGQERIVKEMRRLGISLTQEEFLKAWEMLDIDNSEELTIDEFVSGLSYLHEALCTKHVVNIDYSLKRVSARLDQRIDGLLDDMHELKKQNNEIIDCLNTQEQMATHQSLSLWLWQQWVQSEGGPECANHAPEMGLSSTSVLEGAEELSRALRSTKTSTTVGSRSQSQLNIGSIDSGTAEGAASAAPAPATRALKFSEDT